MKFENIYLPMLYSAINHWYLFVIALLLIFFKTAFFKGWIGEKNLTFSIKSIVKEKKGTLINNLMLPCDNGTTQIDHVLLIPAGIFVIETKNMKGWIFGDAKSRNWTQQIYKHKSKFQNPLHQNYKHVKTIESILSLDDSIVNNIVVFVGGATFKTKIPDNVFKILKLRAFFKKQTNANLSYDQIEEYSNILKTTKFKNSIKNNYTHIKQLKKNTSPKRFVQNAQIH